MTDRCRIAGLAGARPRAVPRRAGLRAWWPRPPTFLSQHYGAPVMLFALLLGMAMNFLSADGPCAPGIEFTARAGAAHRRRAARPAHHRSARSPTLGWQPVLLVVLSVVLTIGVSMLRGAAARLPEPVRPADRRRHRDLRRLGGAGAGRRAAGPSAEGARDAVHRDRRVGAVDAGDDRLPDDRARARPRRARRPASSSAPRSTTWRRWSAPATACRRRPATSPPSSS